MWAVFVKSTHAPAVQRPRNWTCTIEPLRTGTSLLSHSHGSPPGAIGAREVPVLDLWPHEGNGTARAPRGAGPLLRGHDPPLRRGGGRGQGIRLLCCRSSVQIPPCPGLSIGPAGGRVQAVQLSRPVNGSAVS